MNLGAHQLSPKYDFEFAGGQFNSYLFETTHKIVYEVTFKPSPIFLINSIHSKTKRLSLVY